MKHTRKEKPSQLARRNLKRETKKEQEERDKEMGKGRGELRREWVSFSQGSRRVTQSTKRGD